MSDQGKGESAEDFLPKDKGKSSDKPSLGDHLSSDVAFSDRQDLNQREKEEKTRRKGTGNFRIVDNGASPTQNSSPKRELAQSDIPQPKPIAPKALHYNLPQPTPLRELGHSDIPQPKPTPPKALNYELPQPTPPRELGHSDIPQPKPTPPKALHYELPQPSPIAPKAIEQAEIPKPKPILPEALVAGGERTSVNADLGKFLEKMNTSALSIPVRPQERSPLPLPVPRPLVLSHGVGEGLPLPKPAAPHKEIVLPAPLPIKMPEAVTFQPKGITGRQADYFSHVPEIAQIDTRSFKDSTGPMPVLIPNTAHREYQAPAPKRAQSSLSQEPVFITPSTQPVEHSRADSDQVINAPAKQSLYRNEVSAGKSVSKLEAGANNPILQGQLTESSIGNARPLLFKFQATANAQKEPSVYDQGPQMIQPEHSARLNAGVSDSSQRRHANASTGVERVESPALLYGQNNVRLAGVDHLVPLSVNGVRSDIGSYDAYLTNPKLGADGRPLPNQVTWVGGYIDKEHACYRITTCAIDNGPRFKTNGVLPLRKR